MNKMDIVSIGELLVDLTEMPLENGDTAYKLNAGGAPANVVCMAAKLGSKTGFIGKTGRDMFGFYLHSEMIRNGIETAGLILDPNYKTTITFVHNDEDGQRHFEFYRDESWSADLNIRYGEINREMVDSCHILHFGSLCLTAEPARTAVMSCVEYAKCRNKLISYDPNYRSHQWSDVDTAVLTMKTAMQYSDIVKVSEDELRLITGLDSLLPSIASIFAMGVKILCVTQGAKGCIVATPKMIESYPAFKTTIVDTLGAGDSFFGGFLHKLCKTAKLPEELEPSEIEEMAMIGNACGALTSSKKGAIPSMPSADEVQKMLDSFRS